MRSSKEFIACPGAGLMPLAAAAQQPATTLGSGRGPHDFARAGGDADAPPVLAAGGDLHSEDAARQGSGHRSRRRQIFPGPRRTGQGRRTRASRPGRTAASTSVGGLGSVFSHADGIPAARLPADDLHRHERFRPRSTTTSTTCAANSWAKFAAWCSTSLRCRSPARDAFWAASGSRTRTTTSCASTAPTSARRRPTTTSISTAGA